MKVIIPMAGTGQRFIQAGYTSPKPLIPLDDVKGRRILLQHVLDMFQRESDVFVFICNHNHLLATDMRQVIQRLKPNSIVIEIPPHRLGPVFTVIPAFPEIDDDEEVIVSYCDGTFHWDRAGFHAHTARNQLDGCLFTHTGFHPHTLSATTKMAFLKENNGIVAEVKEKASYTDAPATEHASSGVYYFSKGEYVKKYFSLLVKKGLHYNGEYYITLVYNLMIQDGLKVGYFDTDDVAILGTPEEVKNFEAWTTLLKGTQVRNESDLLKCYQYWKKYHAVSP